MLIANIYLDQLCDFNHIFETSSRGSGAKEEGPPLPLPLAGGGKRSGSVLLAEQSALNAERGVSGAIEEEGIASLDPARAEESTTEGARSVASRKRAGEARPGTADRAGAVVVADLGHRRAAWQLSGKGQAGADRIAAEVGRKCAGGFTEQNIGLAVPGREPDDLCGVGCAATARNVRSLRGNAADETVVAVRARLEMRPVAKQGIAELDPVDAGTGDGQHIQVAVAAGLLPGDRGVVALGYVGRREFDDEATAIVEVVAIGRSRIPDLYPLAESKGAFVPQFRADGHAGNPARLEGLIAGQFGKRLVCDRRRRGCHAAAIATAAGGQQGCERKGGGDVAQRREHVALCCCPNLRTGQPGDKH